jgi:phosphoribosylaminoimidazolecarboxamide formyltransferase/IMP cyclohydrolase
MRAILSVSDKTGLGELARGLVALGVEIVASGHTRAHLEGVGIAAQPVEALTGFPEMLDGRVKTLHPAVHGGILARRDRPDHLAQLAEHGLSPIDVVVVNLYPFRETIARPGVTLDEALEQIDIGGPTLLRAAAKNFPAVVVLGDPADYTPVLAEWQRDGAVSGETRRRLAAKAFQHVAAYDTAIAATLRGPEALIPPVLTLALEKVRDLRYGENPHQQAALYRDLQPSPAPTLAGAIQQLGGKELSYNNILDADAALALVRDFASPAVGIIKHANPCGLACRDNLIEAFDLALAGDPASAFGGIVAVNRPVTAAQAEAISLTFFEVVIAPAFEEEAVEVLSGRKNLRLLAVPDPDPERRDDAFAAPVQFRPVSGGFLAQTKDAVAADTVQLRPVTARHPTLEEIADLTFAWRAVKHVKSNAIVLAKGRALVGVGAGQPSRVDSVRIAVQKAGNRTAGSVLASDAFFPFPDGVDAALAAGVRAIIQPGGSVNDAAAIAVADATDAAMVFTGQRHFRH